MKKFCTVIAFVMLLAVFLLTSCEKTTKSDIVSGDVDVLTDSQTTDRVMPVEVDYTIRYYDVIEDKIIEYSDIVSFDNAPDPIFFISKLSELMQIRIGVNSINVSGKDMIIDFSSVTAPLNGTGAYEESCILDSISDTMLSVFHDIDRVYFTQEGKDYESGHISISKDTPYAQR